MSGTVYNNTFTGAFGYAMAITSAVNFTVENNTLIGNTTFIGARGPNCSTTEATPGPASFIIDQNTVRTSTIQAGFMNVSNGDGLTCILPPDGGDFWPYGGNPNPAPGEPGAPTPEQPTGEQSSGGGGGLTGGDKAGIAIGVIFGTLALALLVWWIRRTVLKRAERNGAGYNPAANITTPPMSQSQPLGSSPPPQ